MHREWLEEFIDYLHTNVSPSSTSTYFAKVKCALSESVKDKILIQNPSFFVDPIRVPQASREYLTIEEIQRINDIDFHNDVVKRAFLFSCFSGLRYGDISTLKWSQIQETNFNGNGKSFDEYAKHFQIFTGERDRIQWHGTEVHITALFLNLVRNGIIERSYEYKIPGTIPIHSINKRGKDFKDRQLRVSLSKVRSGDVDHLISEIVELVNSLTEIN